ncbi:hypothetical protein QQ045_012345 [Rhodiola kirilowii]
MASRQRLATIAEEGFKMINQAADENTTAHYIPKPGIAGHTYVTPGPVSTMDPASVGLIDCYQAARRYGGMIVTDYYPGK